MPNYTKKEYSSDYQQNMQNNKKKLRTQNVECIYKTAENRLQKTQKIHKTNLNSPMCNT